MEKNPMEARHAPAETTTMTALQIYKAALEEIRDGDWFNGDDIARAALEAAAKAGELAESLPGEVRARLTGLIRQCSVGQTRFTMEPVTSHQTLGWMLAAIDAYQRGTK
jgi:hypothetical protein